MGCLFVNLFVWESLEVGAADLTLEVSVGSPPLGFGLGIRFIVFYFRQGCFSFCCFGMIVVTAFWLGTLQVVRNLMWVLVEFSVNLAPSRVLPLAGYCLVPSAQRLHR